MVCPTSDFSSKKFSKIKESVAWSQRQLEIPRKKRKEAIDLFVGPHYVSNAGELSRIPTNFIKLWVDILVRQLAAQSPRALLTTIYPALKPVAADFEIALNQIPEEINLDRTLRRFVVEALFSMGIVRVGLHETGTVLGHSYGEPFVDVVTIDDAVIDMSARVWHELQYFGHTYWLDYEEVMDSDLAKCPGREKIKADVMSPTNEEGFVEANLVISDQTTSPYREKLKLRDLWIPSEDILVTYAVTSGELMRAIEWEGPKSELGPYIRLCYTEVPGNLLPLPPVSAIRDLHELGNALYRKMARGADDQKSVLGFSNDPEGVDAFKNAKNGDGISFNSAPPKLLKAGGIDNNTLMFFLQNKELASYFAGNMDTLGGLAAQTQTVGQDRLLSESASALVRDMSEQTVKAVEEIFRALMFYEWNDPVRTRKLQKRIPGTDQTIEIDWNSDNKKGDIDLYQLKLDIFSLQDNSPSVRLQKLGAFVQQYVLPLAPLIENQGGVIDVRGILEQAAKYANLPEHSELVLWPEEGGDVPSIKRSPPGLSSKSPQGEIPSPSPGMSEAGRNAELMKIIAARPSSGEGME